jgi:50S ribosomal subunit-associated GTPase HflX
MSSVLGVAEALRSDLSNGLVQTLAEVAHADVFADFIDMSQHLLDSNYKDASAVIAGSSLEAHLRALCVKNRIDTEQTKPGGDRVPKKADSMNSDLATANIYGKLDQKSITAWLDLRNKAAHGKYTEYDASQVALLIAGVRDFIARNPA